MKQTEHYDRKPVERRDPEPEQQVWKFNTGWILVPIVLIIMSYIFRNIHPSITWERIMDYLHVKNKDAYTRLFHLFLMVTLTIGLIKILGDKKDD